MDITKAVTHIGLCAGYGGIELGLQRIIPNLRSIALCEIEAFAIANLVAKMEAGLMDPAPIWPDLKTFPWEAFRDRVDILTGGYPCQPFSAAGKRAGKDDPRHLWPWIADGIRFLRPKLCFFENVEGHISLGLSDVIEDLAGMGYRTTWGIFSASECGAPHQRKRVFILAHRDSERGQLSHWWRLAAKQLSVGNGSKGRNGLAHTECSGFNAGRNDSRQPKVSEFEHRSAWPSRLGERQYGWEPPRTVGHAVRIESERGRDAEELEQTPSVEQGEASERERGGDTVGNPDSAVGNAEVFNGAGQAGGQRKGQIGRASAERNEREAEPPLGGNPDGTSYRLDDAELCVSCDNRTDELRLLGNGVVPATAERAFRTLIAELL